MSGLGRGDFTKGQPLNHIGVEVDDLDAIEAKVATASISSIRTASNTRW